MNSIFRLFLRGLPLRSSPPAPPAFFTEARYGILPPRPEAHTSAGLPLATDSDTRRLLISGIPVEDPFLDDYIGFPIWLDDDFLIS